MKKILIILLILLLLSGCQIKKTPDFNSDFKIETYKCDMSLYDGVKSFDHNFLGTTVEELKHTLSKKGYGVFVLSRTSCSHCQVLMQYLNEVAKEYNVYVYYIDAESEKYPILDNENYELLYGLLYPILDEIDGEKSLQTPHLFTIIDGEFIDSNVGVKVKGDTPTEKEIQDIKEMCEDFLSPFKR